MEIGALQPYTQRHRASSQASTMQTNCHVLLYDSWTCEDSCSVQLKLLSLEHPFTRLLLHHGSRSRAETREYRVNLWMAWFIRPEPAHIYNFSHFEGYTREAVSWRSSYGPPNEEHLLLYKCVAAWVKSHKGMTLGAFGSPCSINGTVRLDDGEYIGSEIGIHYHPRSRNCVTHDSQDGGSDRQDGNSINDHADLPRLQGIVKPDKGTTPLQPSLAEVSHTTISSSPDAVDRELHPPLTAAIGEIQATREESATCLEGTSAAQPNSLAAMQQIANEEGTSWHCQNYFYLKDAVLSCTQAEVQELLRQFRQRQAHEQCAKLRAELLARVHREGPNLGLYDWEIPSDL